MGEREDAARRHRIRLLQRYVLNPPVKLAVWTGLVPGYVLVETVGRRSGKRRRNVVGMHLDGDTGWVVAEQGRSSWLMFSRSLLCRLKPACSNPRCPATKGFCWVSRARCTFRRRLSLHRRR